MPPTDIETTAAPAVLALDDVAPAAAAREDGACAIPHHFPLDGADMVPPRLSPQRQAVHDAIAGMDADVQAVLLALYFLGRQAGWERLDRSAFAAMLAHAEANLDEVASCLAAKPDLITAVCRALAIMGF